MQEDKEDDNRGRWVLCCGDRVVLGEVGVEGIVTSPRGVLQSAGEENQSSAAETQPKR